MGWFDQALGLDAELRSSIADWLGIGGFGIGLVTMAFAWLNLRRYTQFERRYRQSLRVAAAHGAIKNLLAAWQSGDDGEILDLLIELATALKLLQEVGGSTSAAEAKTCAIYVSRAVSEFGARADRRHSPHASTRDRVLEQLRPYLIRLRSILRESDQIELFRGQHHE